MGEILRCKYLTTTRKKQSKTDGLGALALRKKLEQGGADGERTVGIQEQTNVLYKAKVDYLLSPSQSNIKIATKFQIAWPPLKLDRRLRLSPKLLLQIQQISPNHRPVPVLEIRQPPLRKSKLTRGFLKPLKLSTSDIYVTLREPYITKNEQPQKQRHSQDRDEKENSGYNAREKDIVAAISQLSSNDNPTSEIHFRNSRCIWQASAGSTEQSTPCYRFVIKNEENMTGSEQCQMILQWEKSALSANRDRIPRSRDTEHFILVAIDRKTHRKNRIAIMNPGGFEITIRERLILDHPRTCLAFPDPVSAGGGGPDPGADLETWLYTHVLTLGIWVASQEGWLA
ncbi:hypothetical protein PENPOL_c002G05277 [Penicillium polonicum]|uniref:Uncharacterized protein n=1 Tax=Penicillium polonicum TaxID=60169 RepID=A0A1V6NXQ2_PENPO|nr:hypothetical protein PENPOL_c002G05277 [Penicillium polonicum]